MIDLGTKFPHYPAAGGDFENGTPSAKAREAFDTAVSAPPETSQEELGGLLAAVHQSGGLPAAMDALFTWSLRSGYLTPEKLESNEHYAFYDSRREIEYRVQINVVRSGYSPEPGGAENLPPLHCAICRENIGRPGKEHLRVHDIVLPGTGSRYFLQLTPFPVFPYHFVLISLEPEPMHVDRASMKDITAFLEEAPGYTVCSNSDVEGAGSSILEHHHFQVFKGLSLPAMTAGAKRVFQARDIRAEYLDFECASLRLVSRERDRLVGAAADIMDYWKKGTGGNTGNLIVWRGCMEKGGEWNMIIFFRNPWYQIPQELKRFKSEGIGIIEAAGAAILPVPQGPQAEELHAEIRKNGGRIIGGILEGINPVSPEKEPALWGAVTAIIEKFERS